VADAEVIQLGSRGPAGRGSRTSPSAAARGLAAEAAPTRTPRSGRRKSAPTAPPPVDAPQPVTAEEPVVEPEDVEGPPDEPAEERPDEAPTTQSLGALVAELVNTIQQGIEGLAASSSAPAREFAADPWHGLAALAGRLGVDWPWSVDETVAFARSRLTGDYAVDEFGFDPEFTTKIYLPLLRPLVQSWFRVEVRGGENLPTTGSALLVSNHAGTMPLDGMILHAVVYDEIARHVRMLGADLIFATPYSHDLARKTGTTLACQEDAERLLAADQLVAVFPEGFKGLGKPYADRYKLQRFGRGGFVSAAVRAQVPIIPVSIVGSEEIYPLISTAPVLARALGLPYFPITPLFPWLGLLGLIPLPSKWIIEFGEAVTTDELPPGAAEDPMVVFNVTDQVRETIQHTLYECLTRRRSAFF
jgi:1-acyl-sn-glycerol-3-phosphate acyltransferase